VGKPERKRPFGRPRHRREDNIKSIFKKWNEGGMGMDWMDMAQNRGRWRVIVNAVMYRRVPQIAGNYLINLLAPEFYI
jgi:hypothetical protein